jgi:hypothetical protein
MVPKAPPNNAAHNTRKEHSMYTHLEDMIELHYHFVMKDGTTYSDVEGLFESVTDIREYVEAFRAGDTGADLDAIEGASFFTENGEEY